MLNVVKLEPIAKFVLQLQVLATLVMRDFSLKINYVPLVLLVAKLALNQLQLNVKLATADISLPQVLLAQLMELAQPALLTVKHALQLQPINAQLAMLNIL